MCDDFNGFGVHLLKDDAGDYVAHFDELPHVSAYGSTPKEALLELKEAWQAIQESYRQHNEDIPVAPRRKEYSGRFNVRIDKDKHLAIIKPY